MTFSRNSSEYLRLEPIVCLTIDCSRGQRKDWRRKSQIKRGEWHALGFACDLGTTWRDLCAEFIVLRASSALQARLHHKLVSFDAFYFFSWIQWYSCFVCACFFDSFRSFETLRNYLEFNWKIILLNNSCTHVAATHLCSFTHMHWNTNFNSILIDMRGCVKTSNLFAFFTNEIKMNL